MSMNFVIQVSNPKTTGEKDPEDYDLDCCMQTSFPLETEMAFIQWQFVHIPLTYKYTVSNILFDVLEMLEALLDKQSGEFYIWWPCQEFSSEWNMSWMDDDLTIEAKWHGVIGNTESLLNGLDALKVSKSEFIREWKELLGLVIRVLDECGYDEAQISELSMLKSIYSRIDGVGRLYR